MNRYISEHDEEMVADYEAEMARDGARDWDDMTADEQDAIIAEQEAAAWVSAERRAEIPMHPDLWMGF